MFNNNDTEADFCESYKSEILGSKENEKESSFFTTILKLLIIIMLLVMIVGVSFYGYNYFLNSEKLKSSVLPPVSVQISDDDLVVEAEDDIEEIVEEVMIEKETAENLEVMEEVKVIEKEKLSPPVTVSPQIEEEIEIDMIANEVKIAIAKSEEKEEKEAKIKETIVQKMKTIEDSIPSKEVKSLEVPISVPEAKYLEELADLSKEIDKARK